MKLIGLDIKQVETAIASIPEAKGIVWVGTADDGYFKTWGAAKQFFGTTHNGKPHYSPCKHFYHKLHVALKHPDLKSWAIWLHKHKITKWTPYKIDLAMAAYPCACGAPIDYIPNPTSTHSNIITAPPLSFDALKAAVDDWKATNHASTPKPPKSAGTPASLPTLSGDPITDGETTDVAKLRNATRSVFVATCSMYLLEELRVAAQVGARVPRTSSLVADHRLADYARAIDWAKRLRVTYDGFAARLARNFFDYCTMASFGEARHAQGSKYTLVTTGNISASRVHAYQESLRYDPRSMLPVLEWCFAAHSWGGAYGGPKWANITRAAALYYQLHAVPVAFADHCVGLAHNGGLAFNKGYLLKNPSDHAGYMKMLDTKRNGSLLAAHIKLEVTDAVYRLVTEARALGIIPEYHAALEMKNDPQVPTLRWGTEPLTVLSGTHAAKPVPAVNTSPTTEDATHAGIPETLITREA